MGEQTMREGGREGEGEEEKRKTKGENEDRGREIRQGAKKDENKSNIYIKKREV